MNFQISKGLHTTFGLHGSLYFTDQEFQSLEYNRTWISIFFSPPYDFSDKGVLTIKDPFTNLTVQDLSNLRDVSSRTYLILNFQYEGYSYLEFNFYKFIHTYLDNYKIKPRKIFFLTGNLKEEQNYNFWTLQNNISEKINVISLIIFLEFVRQNYQLGFTLDQTLENIKDQTSIFLSLNNRKKPFRNYSVYKIYNSNFLTNTKISYDKFEKSDFENLPNIDQQIYDKLIADSPKILDHNIGKLVWNEENVDVSYPIEFYKTTMISIVSETWIDNQSNTAMFFTEKTFKPMLFNHPIIIIGQQGMNLYLEKLGFEPYHNFFNMKFDDIENNFDRINAIISELESLYITLSKSIQTKIDWLMQSQETLVSNKEKILDRIYNKSQISKFVDKIRSLEE